ncbi:hypothetical protein [Roseomonas marmotae]|uniref:DUF4164 family protein n=1 Tax=Roseomonas marmotae TaxID=2768161 RepID=A0ABS3KD46_9PROT|nr:hypothetical protein [Roseomonas marmotae]MBO1075394.1 hypothetical protein [Roseomonas marmotae]QTI78383.1 hypothetical protein IAI58_11850 [Roseomonas marmotae]
MAQDTVVLPFPRHDHDRLRLALRGLEAALAGQAEAMQEFRANLAALRQAASGLEGSVEDYRASLDQTATELRQARRSALELQRLAGRMEASG